MISGITLKVCGIRSLAEAEYADRCGADYIGINLYPKSPRSVTLAQAREMASSVLLGKRVAIMVEPTVAELKEAEVSGFDYFQIHCRHDCSFADVIGWSELIGAGRLWLAPRLPPEVDVDPSWLPLAKFFLLDTFQADGFGGSGRTSDWPKFVRHREKYPNKFWVLSGGLGPDNVSEALDETGARFVDVNSGVESSPGVKDRAKLVKLTAVLERRRFGR